MKLTLHTEELEELFDLAEESETADIFVNDLYLAFSPEELARIGALIKAGEEPSLAYRKIALSLLEEEALEPYSSVQAGYGLDSIGALNRKEFMENPYYQRVCKKIDKKTKIGSWTLEMKSYLPYQLFVYDEVLPSPNDPRFSYSPLGYFAQEFPYPALDKNGTTYMSLIPHEIHTMAGPISKAKGRVLTLGLGMGYFAFMASQKDEVSKVVVLERDPLVIDLFKKVFLPLFDHPEKIEIVRIGDALDYEPKEPFDYAFADLHHDASDGLPLYLRLMKKTFALESDVWIEKAILTYFRRMIIALMVEEESGYGDEDYKNPADEYETILCNLHFHLKNVVIDSEDALERFLSDDSLKRIAKDLKV